MLTSLKNLGIAPERQGMYAKAKAEHRLALKLREVPSLNHLSTLDSMNNLGNALYDQCKYTEAEVIYLQALEIINMALIRDCPSMLGIMNNLGLAFSRQGKHDEAEPMHRRALRLKEMGLGCDRPSTFRSINSLGNTLDRQGKQAKVEQVRKVGD